MEYAPMQQLSHISSEQAFKDGRFEDALYMEYARMQQPNHTWGLAGEAGYQGLVECVLYVALG